MAGDPNPINYWDLGVSDGSGLLSPTNSTLSDDPGNKSQTVQIAVPIPCGFHLRHVCPCPALARQPRFVDILMVTTDAAPNVVGDYHLTGTSPAIDLGAASKSGVNAPANDYDSQARPAGRRLRHRRR